MQRGSIYDTFGIDFYHRSIHRNVFVWAIRLKFKREDFFDEKKSEPSQKVLWEVWEADEFF